MLNRLEIKNIALIDNAVIEFSNGFNVLSGETGAGKSVILESLNFVLGAKADKTLIRSGEEYSYVCAEFDVSTNTAISTIFEDFDLDKDDTLIISRKFTIDGKNTIKINGMSANVTMLKKFTSGLVDVHGQSDHFNLLSETNQLKLIDSFGDEEFVSLKNDVQTLYSEYKDVLNKIEVGGGDESARAIRLDVINYQINEIVSADIKEGEEEELISLKQKLLYQEKISNALNSLIMALTDDGGACDAISGANRSLSQITKISDEYSELYDRISNVYAECDDISSTAKSLLESFDFEELDENYIEKRLEKIKQLKKKYGASYLEIQEFLAQIEKEQETLVNFNAEYEKLCEKRKEIEQKLYNLYVLLSDKRKNIAKDFAKKVVLELQELGMSKAKFEINFSELSSIENCKFDSGNGIDKIEFMFSANLGEPVKNLSAVISGGEMSRFMLAIKAQSAKYNETSTYIFDEIDAGISGIVAETVAQKLYKISKNKQVIAITHLPQISVFGDNNLLITKQENSTNTITTVKSLNNEEKINEIIRLVGGAETNSAKSHAIALIERAEEIKKLL